MPPPRHGELVHDLRNLVGLVGSMAHDLPSLIDESPDEAAQVARELGDHARFALDALRVVEHWDNPLPLEVRVGAWAWALRLRTRRLALGELTCSARATIVVPEAIAAGERMLTAIGRDRVVSVESAADGGVVFRAAAGPADADALESAFEALAAAGLRGQRLDGAGCVVRIVAGAAR
jgi:hypothetical protein